MVPWTLLDTAPIPGGGELKLHQRGEEYSIRVGNVELMNSRMHGSEEALSKLAAERVGVQKRPRVLIGGLGMGFTLAAVLNDFGPQAEVVVSELVPAVVTWNRGPLGKLAGSPLNDKRVVVQEKDVAQVIREGRDQFDAILLDVDNGPDGLTQAANEWLYTREGLRASWDALRSGGILAVWSSGGAPAFTKKLQKEGFAVEEVRARARGDRGGARHLIWLARRSR
jgi:spermidine synthase